MKMLSRVVPRNAELLWAILSVVVISTLISGAACGGTSKAASHYLEGERLLDAGKIEDAISEFYQALALKPSSAQTKRQLVRAQDLQIARLNKELLGIAGVQNLSTREAIKVRVLEITKKLGLSVPYGSDPTAEDPAQLAELAAKSSPPDSSSQKLDGLVKMQAACATVLRKEAGILRMSPPSPSPQTPSADEATSGVYVTPDVVAADHEALNALARRLADSGASAQQIRSAEAAADAKIPARYVRWVWIIEDIRPSTAETYVDNVCVKSGGYEFDFKPEPVNGVRVCLADHRLHNTRPRGIVLPLSASQVNALAKGTRCVGFGETRRGGNSSSPYDPNALQWRLWPASLEIPGVGQVTLPEVPCLWIDGELQSNQENAQAKWVDIEPEGMLETTRSDPAPYASLLAACDTIKGTYRKYRDDPGLTSLQKDAALKQASMRPMNVTFSIPLRSVTRDQHSGTYTIGTGVTIMKPKSSVYWLMLGLSGTKQMSIQQALSIKPRSSCTFSGVVYREGDHTPRLKGTLTLSNGISVDVTGEDQAAP